MNVPGTILLVDDDASILLVTRRVLESAGYQLLAARDGAGALSLARNHLPDLILLDVNLPDISGLEVCRQIKADPALAGIFVVMLSSVSTDSESQALGLEQGADGYISRPVAKRELVARIQSIFRIKHAEDALRKSEIETRALYESMNEIFSLHELVRDPSGQIVDYRILDCNPAFERILGIRRAQAIGALASQLYGSGEPPFLDRYAPVAEAGSPITFEAEFAPLGKWFSISVFSPGPGRFATLATDITLLRSELSRRQELLLQAQESRRALMSLLEDRKQIDDARRESQARLDLALQAAQMGIWQWDIAADKRIFDDQACRLLGIVPGTFTGLSGDFFANLYPADREMIRAALARTVEQGEPYEPEYRVVWPDGSLRTISARGKLVRDEAGRSARIIGIIWDSTARKQAEEQLARQADELRRRNDELFRLYRASGSLLSGASLGLDELAKTIISTVQQEFGQANCSLFLLGKASDRIERLAAAGPYADQVKGKGLLLNGPGLVPQAILTGQTLNIPDVSSASGYVPNWPDARSEMAIPLNARGAVIGAIDIQSAELAAFSADDERLMTIFAERAALALDNSRLDLQVEARMRQLMALRTIDMAISSSFDVNLTLGILLEQLIGQLGIHAADILAFNPGVLTFKLACERGHPTRQARQTLLNPGMGYAWRVVRERQVVFIPNLQSQPVALQSNSDLVAEGFAAYMGLPLVAKGQVKGVLEIYHREPLILGSEQLEFLETLAGQAAIALDGAELFERLQGSIASLNIAYDSTLEGWANALEMRDSDTGGHTRRVTDLTVRMARSMGLNENEMAYIYRGALLHDIGKMGVPDQIVLKPGPLTDQEWEIMRMHPQYAYDLLFPIAYLRQALDIPYCHHEKWDGTGYPRGLQGEHIPLAARLFAVVDVWDALTSDRPYRKAWPRQQAIHHIRDQAGKHFDPKVVELFLREIEFVSP